MVLVKAFHKAAGTGNRSELPYKPGPAVLASNWLKVRLPNGISPLNGSENTAPNDSPPFGLPTRPIARTDSSVALILGKQYAHATKLSSSQEDVERIMRNVMEYSRRPPALIYLAGHSEYPSAEAGGMFTEVYQALLESSEPVALKCVRTCMNDDIEKVHRRFIREVLSWSRLEHPNILDVYGVGNVHGRPAIVSPWMGHGSIQEYLTCKPNIDRWDMCQKIAAGLRYLHDNQVIHGDLKAANVLVSNDGIPKISDFGCSLLLEEMFPSSLDLANSESVRWKAPELITIEDFVPAASMATDIYAYGMTMLEVMTGRKPYYQYKSNTYVALAVAEGIHPTRPPELSNASKLANEQWDSITQCWAFQPDRRPSARTILELISNYHYEAHECLRTQT